MAQHIFLTGGTGFLGANVLKRALEDDARVTMLVRSQSSFDQADAVMGGPDWRSRVSCVRTPEGEDFDDWFAGLGVDAVIHTAARGGYNLAPGQLPDLIASNITLGAQLLEAVYQQYLKDGKRRPIVFCGTYWQHSLPDGSYQPNSFYAATKTAFEDIADYYHTVLGQPVLGLKFYDTFGVADLRRRAVDLIINALGADTPLRFSSGTQEVLPLFVDDAADAILRAVNLLERGEHLALTYGAPGPERLSLRQLAALVESRAGKSANIDWGALADRAHEVRKPFALAPLPGWTPKVGLSEGIDLILKGRNG